MDDSSHFYALEDTQKSLKTMTLKPGYNSEGPETLIDPDSKRQLKVIGKKLRKQQIIGVFIAILVLATCLGYIPYNIISLR